MGITLKDLDQCYSDLGSKYKGHKHDYFAPLYLAQEFKGRPEDYCQQVAFGGNDYGLDAFHMDRDARNLYLYQFKWSESHQQFKGSLQRMIEDGFAMVFGDPKQDKLANQFVIQLKSALDENQSLIDRVLVRFVFNGDPEAADKNKTLDSLREDLEAKRYLLDQYFGNRPVALAIEFLSNETKKKSAAVKQKKTHSYSFEMERTIDIATTGGGRLHVGFVPLMALHQWHVEMGARLFDRNIRMGLGGERPTNRAIKTSLKAIADGTAPAELFALDHNGVTISVQRFDIDGGRATVVEPRVLNGAQTVTTVGRFIEDQAGNKLAADGRTRLGEIRVLARILETSAPELVTRITINNNRQNPVEPWHLRASDRMQLELEDRFREELKIFYERQESAFEALSDSDLEDMGIEQTNKAIEIKRLAQTFLAVQGEIDRMSRLSEVFDIQKQYDDCFRASYLKVDLRKVVLCYKVQRRLRSLTDEIREKGGSKYQFVDKARNLVWALVAQGLLNSEQLPRYLEKWGNDLIIDAELSEELKKIASTRVRMILGELIKKETVSEQLDNERYGVLRTKATFGTCMDIAYDKWSWTKKSF